MTCWYSGEGGGWLKATSEVRKILEDFEEHLSLEADDPVQIVREDGDLDKVRIQWYGQVSNATVTEIDRKLDALAPYVASDFALEFEYRHDDEAGFFYVGNERQKNNAKSARALKQIEKVKKDLVPPDREKAIELLSA